MNTALGCCCRRERNEAQLASAASSGCDRGEGSDGSSDGSSDVMQTRSRITCESPFFAFGLELGTRAAAKSKSKKNAA